MLSLLKSKWALILAPVLVTLVSSGVSYFIGIGKGKEGVAGAPLAACPAAIAVEAGESKKDSGSLKNAGGVKLTKTVVTTTTPDGTSKAEETETSEVTWDNMASIDQEVQKYFGVQVANPPKGPRNLFGLTPNYDFEAKEAQAALTYDRQVAEAEIFRTKIVCYAGSFANFAKFRADPQHPAEIRNLGLSGKCGW